MLAWVGTMVAMLMVILSVNQLDKTYWNKQVGPEKIKQKMAVLTKKNLKHIYFNGFEKVSQF